MKFYSEAELQHNKIRTMVKPRNNLDVTPLNVDRAKFDTICICWLMIILKAARLEQRVPRRFLTRQFESSNKDSGRQHVGHKP
jgi:hypothetical protein